MTGRHDDLDPAAVAVINQWSEQLVAERQAARRAFLADHIDRMPCCQDHNRDGALRARRLGYEWEPSICRQCQEWSRIGWMLHNGNRGMSSGEVSDG